MAACNAASVSKSAFFWKKIVSPAREQLLQMCMRNGISRDMLDGAPATSTADAASGQGQARIDSVPAATIMIDGKEVGAAPLLIKLPAGKHKETFRIGHD